MKIKANIRHLRNSEKRFANKMYKSLTKLADIIIKRLEQETRSVEADITDQVIARTISERGRIDKDVKVLYML